MRVILIMAVLPLYACTGGHKQVLERPTPDIVEMEIFYATDRDIEDESEPGQYYGGNRGAMSYGIGRVAINTDKSFTEYADAGYWGASEFETGKSAQLAKVEAMTLEQFLERISERAGTSPDKSAMVYTHGYARRFEQAAGILASVVYKIGYLGVPVLYSWPSNGSAAAYAGDLNNVEWTVPHFRETLKQLAELNELETIHLAAHSLGNRAFLRALMQLVDDADAKDGWKFGEILLIAPDLDRDIFERDVAPVIVQSPSRVTLYVSSVDVPLRISKSVNLYPRVGDASEEPFIFHGIDTIDASNVADVTIGHSYYRESPEVLKDMYYLLVQRRGADDRPTLEAVDTAKGRYWKIID